VLAREGVGARFDPDRPFILVSQHPVTTEYGMGEFQVTETLAAVRETGYQSVVLWPNADAGSEDVARGIRKYREKNHEAPFHYVKNLPPEIYISLMAKTSCLVGNSSSAIREGAFIGTPAINIGSRQVDRQRGSNVIDAAYDRKSILKALDNRLTCGGRLKSEPIYGDGKAGPRIAHVLATVMPDINKRITY
jgi:UDP-N-acetylglucosamine 2-epimerase